MNTDERQWLVLDNSAGMKTKRNPNPSTRPRALLLGAGHAHLYSLKRAAEFSRRGFELVAVAPENFWYSGLATGVLGGRYSPEADQVETEKLMRYAANCRFIHDRVTEIDPKKRLAQLQSGEELSVRCPLGESWKRGKAHSRTGRRRVRN